MAIDVVKEIIGLKNAYGRMRGAGPVTGKVRPTGGTWMRAGKQVPQTTWGDVIVAANHINKYLAPTREQCIELVMKHKGVSKSKATSICIVGGRGENPSNFKKTQGYKTALRNFRSVEPAAKGGFFVMFKPSKLKEIYPYNEEFWGGALTLAIERSAAGAVPYWNEIAIESVKEAAKELPEHIGRGLAKLNPIPDMSPLANIIKWGSIGGGLFMLYWYVLKPKKRKA